MNNKIKDIFHYFALALMIVALSSFMANFILMFVHVTLKIATYLGIVVIIIITDKLLHYYLKI